MRTWLACLILCVAVLLSSCTTEERAPNVIVDVSYDATRELHRALAEAFTAQHLAQTGERIEVRASHAGSAKQARAVLEGFDADVVSLALEPDIDMLATRAMLVPRNWREALPNQGVPFRSTIAFLVRKGNPKRIRDFDDLIRSDVRLIVANPKTSGAARWAHLAAWGYAKHRWGSDARADEFVKTLYQNVPVLPVGARAATVTFARQGIGDVLVGWESEALRFASLKPDEFEVVVPPASISAEPPMAVVPSWTERHGNRALVESFAHFFFTEQAQRIAVEHFMRPTHERIAAETQSRFANVTFFTVQDVAGSWQAAHARHFAEGALFDRIQAALADAEIAP